MGTQAEARIVELRGAPGAAAERLRRVQRRSPEAARILLAVAEARHVRVEGILAAHRGRAVIAEARQIAMYLCNTLLGLSLTEVGVLFERDRTTVGHACAAIEDRRDEGAFEAEMTALEMSLAETAMPQEERRNAANC